MMLPGRRAVSLQDRGRRLQCGCGQRGQALTELVVLAAVLVPLFLLVPVLAKYIHLRQVNQQAARAAAWEATVSPSYALPAHARTQELLIARHFARADAPIQTRPPAGQTGQRLDNVFLNTFSDQPLLERADIRLSAYRNERRPGFTDDLLGNLESLPGSFPPNTKGYVTAEVTLRPQNLRTTDGRPAAYLAPFDSLDLQLSSRHTLLADAWNAAGPGQGRNPHDRSVLAQVRTLVPSSYLGSINPNFGSVIRRIPFIGVIGRLEPGYIAPDVVPHERLQPYARSH